MMLRNMWIFGLIFLLPAHAFIVVVPDSSEVGTSIFEANLDGPTNYKLDPRRTDSHVHRFVHVNYETGEVTVKRELECSGAYYSNPISLWVEAWSDANPALDYVAYPLRILVTGSSCDHVGALTKEVSSWRDTTSLSIALPESYGKDESGSVCIQRSQVIVRIPALLPKSLQTCKLNYNRVSDARFAVEKEAGDLVSLSNVCLGEITRVTVWIRLQCHHLDTAYEHGLMLLLHNDAPPPEGTVRRTRRQMAAAAPYFERPLIEAQVREEENEGTPVTTVTATDPEGAALSYSIKAVRDSRSENMFNIDPSSGLVSTTTRLDRELMDEHYFRVIAVDQAASPPRTATTNLKVTVADANDHDPVFEREEYFKSVPEGPNSGNTLLKVRATDQDAGPNAAVTYTLIESSDPDKIFRLDPRTGELESRLPLDREQQAIYHLTVQAEDGGPPQERRSTTAKIVLTILDENDNYPQFSESTYTVEVPEDISAAASPVIAHIRAIDADSGENGEVRYAIIGGNTAGHFTIDGLTGEVRVVSPLDHEGTKSYRLVIRAQDSGSPPRSKTTQLLVNVRDVNDNVPRFYTPLFQETVQENVPVGYSIVRVQAFDSDEGDNAVLSYRLEGGGIDLPVSVDPSTGWVVTQKELDREENHHYTFTVIAADQGDPPRSATSTVVLQIQDQNDNDPIFNPKNYEVAISETEQPGTPVVTVTATDRDEDPRLHYAITSGNQRGRFSITAQNGRGVISLAQPLDFKQERRYVLAVTATDAGGRHDSATVYVNVTDANTFPPVFENTPYSATIFEDAPAGSTVLVVSAADSDSGENSRITYSLSGESQPEFTIHPSTGAITTTRLLDRESQGGYLLTVTARDNGKPPLADTTDVEITVVDVNDNAPVFSAASYRATVSEDKPVGTSIAQIKASDADASHNGNIRYTFEGGDDGDSTFALDPTSGVLRTARLLDRETVSRYNLIALAADNGDPPRSTSVVITVDVDDINDNAPMFDTEHIQLYIAENSPIGSTVGEVRARDPDAGRNAIIEYSITGGVDAGDFVMVAHPTEGRAELITRIELDYESSKKKYYLEVSATSDTLSSYVPVTVHVVDVNDNKPVLADFRIIFNNFKDHFPVGPIGRVPAVDADVTDQLSYSVVSGNKAGLLNIGRDSGEISLSPALNNNVATTATMRVAVSGNSDNTVSDRTLLISSFPHYSSRVFAPSLGWVFPLFRFYDPQDKLAPFNPYSEGFPHLSDNDTLLAA
ncbi:protocadherin-like wing polarity protein stan [Hyalella azteca]|uniref:Protocadherin-like wing polarity protein stan n=1 Tax=Hyalella azteca TaxID=294128 RepID=A0A8B7NZY5_HYAAZ|nr:protocadherin-like wing polarity protein stan [Hyalella azteca]